MWLTLLSGGLLGAVLMNAFYLFLVQHYDKPVCVHVCPSCGFDGVGCGVSFCSSCGAELVWSDD